MKYLLSGPPSCLCSRVEACENDGEFEVDYITDVFEVTEMLTNPFGGETFCLRRLTARPYVLTTLTVDTTLGIRTISRPWVEGCTMYSTVQICTVLYSRM